jgi:hypothetical protein
MNSGGIDYHKFFLNFGGIEKKNLIKKMHCTAPLK